VAERKRRGGQAASGRHAGAAGGSRRDEEVDETVVDAEDGAVADEVDEADADLDAEDADLTEDDEDADDLDAEEGSSAGDRASERGAGGTATATKATPKSAAPEDQKQGKEKSTEPGALRRLVAWFAGLGPRFVDFVREVVAELRKVIWPTRTELVTYTSVVVVFVVMMLAIVGLLDLGFAKGVLLVFGGGSDSSN
jgi:preprotein translocase subunit SecE